MTTTPNFEDLLAELREDLVNSLDDAMGKCPHEGVSSKWDLCNACAADTAVEVVRHLFGRELAKTRAELEQAKAQRNLAVDWLEIPAVASQVWDDSVPPGGYVCSVCRTPVESEPCPLHGDAAQP